MLGPCVLGSCCAEGTLQKVLSLHISPNEILGAWFRQAQGCCAVCWLPRPPFTAQTTHSQFTQATSVSKNVMTENVTVPEVSGGLLAHCGSVLPPRTRKERILASKVRVLTGDVQGSQARAGHQNCSLY